MEYGSAGYELLKFGLYFYLYMGIAAGGWMMWRGITNYDAVGRVERIVWSIMGFFLASGAMVSIAALWGNI
jgi:hypothetical protein